MRGHSLVELTEHDNSAADIRYDGMYRHNICIAAFIIDNVYLYRCSHTYMMHIIQQ